MLRYTDHVGSDVETSLALVEGADVARGCPVRRFGMHAGMGHYPGWWWSSTMQDLVGHESLLERDRLMLADFDRDVTAVASQPFGITGRDGAIVRRHVPDYLLLRSDGTVQVVDVKSADQLARPEVADVFEWTSRLMAAKGWRYSIWSGADAVMLRNVRFLAQGRRAHLVDGTVAMHLVRQAREGMPLRDIVAETSQTLDVDRRLAQSALLVLLWHQVFGVSLQRPICGDTRIDNIREDRRAQFCA